MKISGFSFVKNAVKLYYPVEESIRSVLPICDEFVIAVGKGDDNTREVIEGIGDPRIRIIDTDWDSVETIKKLVMSQQTNIALKECTGDWCFYIQADEVVHEDDLPLIRESCLNSLDDDRVHGLLFDYLHFWGDYDHCHDCHGWYPREIRVVRNGIGVKSVRDAQSFRLGNDKKLNVALANARVFHYGYVRPPHLMQNKAKAFRSIYVGKKTADEQFKHASNEYDYGALNMVPRFTGTHPSVMKKKLEEIDWKKKLRDIDPPGLVQDRALHKHERSRNRLITKIEKWSGIDFNHKNWRKIVRT